MHVYYRMTSKTNAKEHSRPLMATDKLGMVAFCLRSFVRGFSDLPTPPRVHFLLDDCDAEWDEMIEKFCPFPHDVTHVSSDQADTYKIQLRMAKSDVFEGTMLFQEDDYFYLPRVGSQVDEAIRVLKWANPFDHMEFYTKTQFHPDDSNVRLVGGHHWRTVNFNTMTYGTTVEELAKHFDTLMGAGYMDFAAWKQMRDAGVKLWCPIPTLCTHMMNEDLSPCVNWKEAFNVDVT